MGLPWHPSGWQDAHPLIPGRPTRLEIDLMPVSYVLRPGHCLRLEITGFLQGFYAQTSEEPVHLRLHRDSLYTSYITIPVQEPEENE